MSTKTLYKLEINGIVYLVEPTTGDAYTYEPESPTHIGKITAGSGTTAFDIVLRPDWQEVLRSKFDPTHRPATTA